LHGFLLFPHRPTRSVCSIVTLHLEHFNTLQQLRVDLSETV
jgi:hypothetical protein